MGNRKSEKRNGGSLVPNLSEFFFVLGKNILERSFKAMRSYHYYRVSVKLKKEFANIRMIPIVFIILNFLYKIVIRTVDTMSDV